MLARGGRVPEPKTRTPPWRSLVAASRWRAANGALVAAWLAACGGGGSSGDGASGTGGSAASGTAASGAQSSASSTGGGAATGSGTGGAVAAGSGGANASGSGGASSGGSGAGDGAGGTDATGGSGTGGAGSMPWEPSFTTRSLSEEHYAEGAGIADVNGDGQLDLVAGPRWYAGPGFELGGVLFDAPTFTRDAYSTFFLAFVDDLNGDTYPDVIAVGDAGGNNGSGNPNTYWYENPGPAALDQDWAKHSLFDGLVANESPVYLDLVGDAKKELVFMTDDELGYAVPGATPTDEWTFHPISGSDFNTPYVHGLGVGDVDGDGLADVVEREGWWKQIDGGGGDPTWERHEVDFGEGLAAPRANNWGGGQMHVFDVDGDGNADVVTGLAAHQYGLSWFEQVGEDDFTPHAILPPAAASGNVSQLHSLGAADLNGDDLLDLVAGKRYYAHPSTNPDPGTDDPAMILWFELVRDGGTASFVQHEIHDDSGAGCVFAIQDVDDNGRADIFTTNKRGTFLHLQD